MDREQDNTLLSDIWNDLSQDRQRRQNFECSLAKLILDLAQPFPRIGSLTVDGEGCVALTNRPLTKMLLDLENEGIPQRIPQDRCYENADAFMHDLLDYHDLRLALQPNAVRDEDDATGQMSALATMRSVLQQFNPPQGRWPPFVFQITDLHPGNIFVRSDGRISAIVDLEWGCALPRTALHPPFWLTHRLDELEGVRKQQYEHDSQTFLLNLQSCDMERSQSANELIDTMRLATSDGMHWYWASLLHPQGLYNLFYEHIQPLFSRAHQEGKQAIMFQDVVHKYWTKDSAAFISAKVQERELYTTHLRATIQSSQNSVVL